MSLIQHIKKEDEILYPWMDRELSDSQIGRLFSRFQEVDSSFGDTAAKYAELITRLETANPFFSEKNGAKR